MMHSHRHTSSRSTGRVFPRHRTKTGAFTLVELLVVVSILLLVAVIALPSVGSLSKSASRRAAVSQAMGVFDQARAVALSQGVTVYVVFANGDESIPEDYRYRSYAVFREVYFPENHDYIPSGETKAAPYHLEVVRQWSKLPEGICFTAKTTEKTVYDGLTDSFPFKLPKTGDSSSKVVLLPYLRFNAMGLLEDVSKPGGKTRPDDSARVRLFEGFVKPDGTLVRTNAAREKADESVIVSTVTGRARREEAASAA